MANLKNKVLRALKSGKTSETILEDVSKSQENLIKNSMNPVFSSKDKSKLLKSFTDLQDIGKSLYRYNTLLSHNYLSFAQEEKENIENVVLKGGISTTRYIWRSEHGEHTCDVCADLDGKVFDYYDEVPEPPHPNCKCTVEIVEDDDVNSIPQDQNEEEDSSYPKESQEQSSKSKTSSPQSSEITVINSVYEYLQSNNGQIPSTKITENISWREMIGHDNTNSERKNECTKEVLANIYHTAQQLQKVHDTYWKGRPLIISSGWRSVRKKKKNSRHLYGKAIDFNLGLPTIKSDYAVIKKVWKGFVLFEGTWIHIQL